MTSKDVEAELERDPFVPIRIHLVSGKPIEVPSQGVAFPMQNALLILQRRQPGRVRLDGYDVVSFRNMERIEQLHSENSDAA